MPNWCDGEMTITGSISHILDFLHESITKSNAPDVSVNEYKDIIHEPGKITLSIPGNNLFWFVGTHRNFVDYKEIVIEYEVGKEDLPIHSFTIPITSAWDNDHEVFEEFARKFNISIYSVSEEPGQGFQCTMHFDPFKDEFWHDHENLYDDIMSG